MNEMRIVRTTAMQFAEQVLSRNMSISLTAWLVFR
jgi:hypothetical protein